MQSVAHSSNRRGLSLRSADTHEPTKPDARVRAAARKIVRGLQIDSFIYGDAAGFRTYEHGRLTRYAATEQNVRDVLWQRWHHWPRRGAAVREAVRMIVEQAEARRRAA